MSVKYTLVQKGIPGRPEEPKKWYASTKSTGEITLKSLSKEISEGSTTVSDTDVLAVLNDLTKILRRHLSEGRIVKLGDFGSFQVSISSSGAESKEKFTPSLIKSNKVLYRPGADIRETLKTIKYEKEGK